MKINPSPFRVAPSVNVKINKMSHLSLQELNVLPFPKNRMGWRYKQEVMKNLIDVLYISWIYERGSPLALIMKEMKARGNNRSGLMIADWLGENGWMPVLSDVTNWIRDVGGHAIVIAVPSRFGTSERLTKTLVTLLNRCDVNIAKIELSVIQRTNHYEEIKEHEDWNKRKMISEKLFEIRTAVKPNSCVLLVDDVVSSGSSLRSCARLLRWQGVKNIAAAVLSGSPQDAPREWYL